MSNLPQKRAIIVGATSGIGKELAIVLTQNNFLVGITGRRKALLDELQQLYNCEVSCFDIKDTATAIMQLTILTQQLGGLDLLIISSGYGDNNPDLDNSIEQSTIDTNVTGFTAVVGWAYTYFKQQGRGHIVNISSIGGLRGGAAAPSYGASKAYQINYLEGLQQKSNRQKANIRFTDVRPGFVDTAMAKSDKKFWVSSPQKAAADIWNAITKQRQVVYVTKRWEFIALLLKLLPRKWYVKL